MFLYNRNRFCLQAQLDEQTRLLSERGMVLVGNEDEEVSCEDQDRANANGYFDHELRPDDDQVLSFETHACTLGESIGLNYPHA